MKDELGHGSNGKGGGFSQEYLDARAQRDAHEANVKAASEKMKAFPKEGPMNITPDHVKRSPEYQSARRQYEQAFNGLRNFNSGFVKRFSKEIRQDRPR